MRALPLHVATGTVGFGLLDIACGFVRSDRRFGHDPLTELVVVKVYIEEAACQRKDPGPGLFD